MFETTCFTFFSAGCYLLPPFIHLYITYCDVPLQVFTEEQLDAAQQDLRKIICDAYEGTPPPACSKVSKLPKPENPQDRVKLSVFYETLCDDSQNFIINHLYRVYLDLMDIIELDINVYGKINVSLYCILVLSLYSESPIVSEIM